jgi:hypothetical protein
MGKTELLLVNPSNKKHMYGDLGPLFSAIEPPLWRFKEIPPVEWNGWTTSNPLEAHYAFDRDFRTRWMAEQKPGVFYQLDLGKIYPVGKVVFLPGQQKNKPVGIRLEVSQDSLHWDTALEVSNLPFYGLFWGGFRPIMAVDPYDRVELIFPPRPARYVPSATPFPDINARS